MKRLAAALTAFAAVAMAPAAQATTTVLAVTDTQADGSFTTSFSDANMVAGLGGLFTETLDFTTLTGLLGIRVNTIALRSGGPNDTDISRAFLSGGGLTGRGGPDASRLQHGCR